ncbi:hypothetical protein NEA10_09985 [Phormidium yuhuli AB48]|uniref:Uncharacterized protein n=1 Tax=Phormidium yuhuli AB48 TaxID=2940671 RepID=A0ABY5AY70_9CYAN|nr:hypothetical protein [Phormidium yuhuli]USR93018.1 hypothetical protein NEA10_09985 [Phormidium yuhuli AB48]
MARSRSPLDRPAPSLGHHRSHSRHSLPSRQGDHLGFEARHLTNDDGESITIYLPHR